MDLHDKQELKEQLTEHLYTIIHQNEVRKAKKLADLMHTLEMEAGEDEDICLPELPPLTSFQPTGSKHISHYGHPEEHTKEATNKKTTESNSSVNGKQGDSVNGKQGDSENIIEGSKVNANTEQTDCNKDSGSNSTQKLEPAQNKDEKNKTEESTSKSEILETNGVKETVDTTKKKHSESSQEESPTNAIDLSIIKTEPVEENTTVEKLSKPLEKTAWDFDGSLK